MLVNKFITKFWPEAVQIIIILEAEKNLVATDKLY